jgi:hypothetical protein
MTRHFIGKNPSNTLVMRQGQNNKRSRGRPNNRKSQSGRSYDSNGPDVKIRGTASHIYEKYQSLARDAQASGDRIVAENYLQHAEHYFRVMLAAEGAQGLQNRVGPSQPPRPAQGTGNGPQEASSDGDDADTGAHQNTQPQHSGDSQPQPQPRAEAPQGDGEPRQHGNGAAPGNGSSSGNGHSSTPHVEEVVAAKPNGAENGVSASENAEQPAAPEQVAVPQSGQGREAPPRRRGRPPRERDAAPAPDVEAETGPETSEPAS